MTENNTLEEKKIKLDWWKGKGVEPYGRKYSKEDISKFLQKESGEASIAGRIMGIRRHGKAAFCDVSDNSGKIQAYFKKDLLGDEQWENFKNFDVGDIIGLHGELFKTHTGQLTLLAKSFVLLSKNLMPLPEKWHGLKDVKIRSRRS